MAHSVTEAQSHDKGRGKKCNRSSRECNGDIKQKSNWGHGETSGLTSVMRAWQQCMVYSRAWECSYKLNDQPIREWVTASNTISLISMTLHVDKVISTAAVHVHVD